MLENGLCQLRDEMETTQMKTAALTKRVIDQSLRKALRKQQIRVLASNLACNAGGDAECQNCGVKFL